MMMAQVSAAALTSECKILAHPASVDSIPTGGSKEDVVPMAMTAASKLRRVIRNVRYVLAIELVCAAQGVDFRAPLKPGRGVGVAHKAVRRRVAKLGDDRVLSTDLERVAQAIADGELTPRSLQS
jgi:histidine ammonia-lyase